LRRLHEGLAGLRHAAAEKGEKVVVHRYTGAPDRESCLSSFMTSPDAVILDSIVRCIKAGAEDHLPKPFNASLPKARTS
jgi:hypothetical protein